MNERVVFASDIHLDHRVPARIDRFDRFLFHDLPRLGAKRLFLLGDILNIWYRDPRLMDLYGSRVFEIFHRFIEEGNELEFVVGNRDFGLCFDRTVNLPFPLHTGPIRRTLGSRRFYLCHGDHLAKKDYGYHLLHGSIRRKIPMAIFHSLGSRGKERIVNLLIDLSHDSKERKARWRTEPYWPYLEKMVDEGVDICVQGHKHEQTYRLLEGRRHLGKHFILPRWYDRACGLLYDLVEDRFHFFDLG